MYLSGMSETTGSIRVADVSVTLTTKDGKRLMLVGVDGIMRVMTPRERRRAVRRAIGRMTIIPAVDSYLGRINYYVAGEIRFDLIGMADKLARRRFGSSARAADARRRRQRQAAGIVERRAARFARRALRSKRYGIDSAYVREIFAAVEAHERRTP